MNILVFSWRDPKHPTAGGAEQVMHEHMRGWVNAGHRVTLFASRVKGLPRMETIDGVRIVRGGIQYFGVQIAGFIYYLRSRKNFDLIVDQFHGLPFFTPLYINKPILAVIQEVAGKVWLKNELPFPLNHIFGVIGYLGEPALFLFYRKTRFMTGSESAKKSLIKVGISSKNIDVINHGIIIERPRPFPVKEKTKTIIFLGAISKDKGIEDVLRTFSILNKKGNYKFWIVGKSSGFYEKYINDSALLMGISSNLTCFGFVSQKRKFELLARAHVMINPSLLEGFGLVNIEANAMGTPVVAYSSLGLVDSVKNGVGGVLCKRNTPEELAREVSAILKNKSIYEKLRKGGIFWSKKFDWKRSKKLSCDLIDRIAGKN